MNAETAAVMVYQTGKGNRYLFTFLMKPSKLLAAPVENPLPLFHSIEADNKHLMSLPLIISWSIPTQYFHVLFFYQSKLSIMLSAFIYIWLNYWFYNDLTIYSFVKKKKKKKIWFLGLFPPPTLSFTWGVFEGRETLSLCLKCSIWNFSLYYYLSIPQM